MHAADRIFDCLSAIEPFTGLPERIRHEVAESARIVRLEAKMILFSEGESGESGYVVLCGRLSLSKISPNGKELIVELLPRGELFGLIAVLDTRPYPLTARALVDSEVIAIPRSAMRAAMAKEPVIAEFLVRLVSSRLRHSHELSRALAHDRVEVRVAAALLALLSRNGDAEHVVTISRQELADITGISLETASRCAKRFEEQGILDLSEIGKVVVRNRESLSTYL